MKEENKSSKNSYVKHSNNITLSTKVSISLLAIVILLIFSIFTYAKYSGNCNFLGATLAKKFCEQDIDLNKKESLSDNKLDVKLSPKSAQQINPAPEILSTVPHKSQDQELYNPAVALKENFKTGPASSMVSGKVISDNQAKKIEPNTDIKINPTDPVVAPVLVEEPIPEPIYETPALLIANNKQMISSPKSAKIKSFSYKDGQNFNINDVLITFECDLEQHDLEIQQELKKQAEISFENLSKLDALKSASKQQLKKAESDLELAKKRIAKLERSLKDCVIIAEYSGKVIKSKATEKEFVVVGQELLSVNNQEDLLIKAYIPVEWLEWIKLGTDFDFCLQKDLSENISGDIKNSKNSDSLNNNCYKAVITRLGAEVDATSQTIDIFAKLIDLKKAKLIPGLSGQIIFDKPDL